MEKSKRKKNKMLDILKIVIIIFTISVLAMNVAHADRPVCKKNCSPAIISYNPPNLTIYDNPPATETFSITVNQTVNVTWFFDGVVHKTDNSVSISSDIIDTSSIGVHNVTAVAQNEYGMSVSQTWTWNVYPPPQIIYYEPLDPIIYDTGPATRSFFIILDQDTYGTWCWNTSLFPLCWEPPMFNPAGQLWGLGNITGSNGTNNITITASNNNGTVSKSWTWIVNNPPSINITDYYPKASTLNVTAPSSISFGVSTEQMTHVKWIRNGVSSEPCTIYVYTCSTGYTFGTAGTEIITANMSTPYPVVYADQTWIVNVN